MRQAYLVQHPLGLVVQAGGGMQVHHLVVLDSQVVTGLFQMGHLRMAQLRLASLPSALPPQRATDRELQVQAVQYQQRQLWHAPA